MCTLRPAQEEVLSNINRVVTDEDNEISTQPFSEEEIKSMVMEMPRGNSFNILFLA